MQRLAAAIGISHPPELFDKLVAKATFKCMKSNVLRTAPSVAGGLYKDPSAFFNIYKGCKREGKWNEVQLADYNARIATLLSVEDVRYRETGLTHRESITESLYYSPPKASFFDNEQLSYKLNGYLF